MLFLPLCSEQLLIIISNLNLFLCTSQASHRLYFSFISLPFPCYSVVALALHKIKWIANDFSGCTRDPTSCAGWLKHQARRIRSKTKTKWKTTNTKKKWQKKKREQKCGQIHNGTHGWAVERDKRCWKKSICIWYAYGARSTKQVCRWILICCQIGF